jgi:hypothetical protein
MTSFLLHLPTKTSFLLHLPTKTSFLLHLPTMTSFLLHLPTMTSFLLHCPTMMCNGQGNGHFSHTRRSSIPQTVEGGYNVTLVWIRCHDDVLTKGFNGIYLPPSFLTLNVYKNICYLGLHKVLYYNKANKLEVVLIHHNAFTGHLR